MSRDRTSLSVAASRTDSPASTRAERLADATIHVIGILASLIAVPVIVTLAAVWFGDASTVSAALVYGTRNGRSTTEIQKNIGTVLPHDDSREEWNTTV